MDRNAHEVMQMTKITYSFIFKIYSMKPIKFLSHCKGTWNNSFQVKFCRQENESGQLGIDLFSISIYTECSIVSV